MTKTRLFFRAIPIFAAAAAAFAAPAGSPVIGMAAATGSFRLDRTPITGNATVFDGSTIETAASPLQIQLNGGQRLRFSTDTRVRVFGKKAVLETGFGQIEASPGYEVEARSLRISAATPGTVTRIRLAPGRKVIVGAVSGSVRVTNAAGFLVATVPTGGALDFEPQDQPQAKDQNDKPCKSDSDKSAESAGDGKSADKDKDKRGCGGAVAAGAAAAGAAGAGAAAAGAGAAGAAAAGGIGAGTIAVIGGVATAATVGGLAAVGELPGQGTSNPPTSVSP